MIENIIRYSKNHTTPSSDILYDLERQTYLQMLSPQMISGPLQGRLLSFISQMIRPKAILEIGTFTGYATICLAQGLQDDGIFHTIEVNEEQESFIRKYLKKANLADKVQLHIGDAKQIIPTLSESFDIILIDANKAHNGLYYDMVFDKLKIGGFILVDNVLWSGKVVNPKDKDARQIDAFNKKIQADKRVENVLLPIRDGLTLIRKIV